MKHDRPDPTDQKYRIFFPEESSTKTSLYVADCEAYMDHLEGENKWIKVRVDWTVEDNAKKAIELADTKAELQASNERVKEMETEIQFLKSDERMGNQYVRWALQDRLEKMKADVDQPPAGILKVQELIQAFFGDT